MTTTRRAPARKPTAPAGAAPKMIAKPTPVDAADAAMGRTVRTLLECVLQVVMWGVSGLLAIAAYRTYPTGGVWGAVLMDTAIGLVLVCVLVRWGR